MTLTAGTQLGHYEITVRLGAGGMGEVWLAEDTRLRRKVALKLLPAELTSDAERLRRFEQEAQAASALNHPNIITVYDIGDCEAGRFIVMELVAGRTLRTVIAEDNSVETLLALGQQMAKALSAAHAAGITHRDIKPDNIMVREDGYVKVLDFGLARLNPMRNAERGMRNEEAETLAQQTMPGTVMGTVAYMSPEQARGEPVNHPSDIFALGIVLYELATGRHPFKAETLVGYLHAITLQEPQPLTQWKPELPVGLNDLILRMLSKDARQRPTASEVAQTLQDIERRGDTVKWRSGDDETMMLPAAPVSAPRADEGFWVAVLPFKWRGMNAELEALAEGLSEDIVTGLSRFSYLRVIARGSTLRFTSETSDVRAIGKELGARYVMEGSLRQAGSMLRVAVQLVDASTGAHLWAETYDRQFRAEDIFALQDDLVPRIVSTVADQYGALVHSMSESLRGRSAGEYSTHEAVLRAFGYWERVTPDEHREAREILEAVIARAPGHSDCQAMLATLYWHEYAHGYNVRPDPLGRAHAAAQRAVAAAPTSHLAHYVLATVLFFQKDFPAMRPAAERALALNRMDASTTAALGFLIAYAGDWEYGLGLVEQAMQLNPHHPGWYHLPAFYDAYRRRDYRRALESALKINVPGYFWPQVARAVVYGQLGEQQRARAALQELHALMPNFGAVAREEFGKWFDVELTEHLIDGLKKAGLAIADAAQSPSSHPAAETREADAQSLATTTSPTGSSPTQSIAVLPFANISADEENEYFCDGLAEELLNALAKIDELKVAARTSAFSFKGKNTEAREIGKTLNVNTVLEGSVRKAGNRIRINVQLVNAADGYHLWSERYDREMKDIFDVQDEITLAVVDALQLKLLGAKKAAVLKRYTDNTEAYELYLKGRFFWDKLSPAGIEKAIEYFNQAVLIEPDFALAYAGLADSYAVLSQVSAVPVSETMPKAREFAEKALSLDADLAEAHTSLGLVLADYDYDFVAAETCYTTAIKLNPNNASAHHLYGQLLAQLGRHTEAEAALRQAIRLDPLSILYNWQYGFGLYEARRNDEAMAQLQKVFEMDAGFPLTPWLLAAIHQVRGNHAEAAENFAKFYELAGNAEDAARVRSSFAEGGWPGFVRMMTGARRPADVTGYLAAALHASLGEKDAAFARIEKAYDSREAILSTLITNDPRMDSLRDDPRFAEMLRRIGLPTDDKGKQDVEAQPVLLSTEHKNVENLETILARQRHTVGREPERNELRAAFNAAKGGRGSLLCVAGEPGIGKTTLVEDFLTELTADNQCTIARGRCSERLAGTEAYLPLLEALESLLACSPAFRRNDVGSEALPPEGGTTNSLLKQLAPTWYAQVVPLSGDSDESARLLAEVKAASQERMKRELANFLQTVAEAQPLVIFFDDLHWADVSTIDLLSFLAGKFDALRVLIVTTYRPSDMLLAKHPFLQIKPDLQARGLCRELQLAFLNEAEIAQYLNLEFPNQRFPTEFPQLIHAKTEGSPLFMADLVRYLRDRGVIAQSSGAWKLEQTLPDIERELPESVRGMIERKIAQLSEDDRKLLTAASVQGYEFDSAVVAQVLKLEADEVEERLEKLERVFAFVKLTSEAEFSNRTLTLKYRFVHVLYQNALYGALRITRKASLSREVAQTLEGFYGEQRTSVANQLAALYEAGRESARAAEYYRLAAEHSTQVFAYQEAVVLARRGLGLLTSEPDTTARTRQELALQITLSVPLGACRGLASQESREPYTRARELAQQLGDPPELWTIMVGQWRSYLVGGDNNTALRLAEEFLAMARTKAPAAMVWAHQMMTSSCNYRGEFTLACAHTREMLAIRNLQPQNGEAVIYAGENPLMIGLFMGAASQWYLGYPEQALQQSREALALARQDASPFGLALATFLAAELHISRREHQHVRELAEDCLALSTEHGFPQWLANGNICRGWALVAAGQEAAGVAQMREGLTAMHAFEADLGRSRYLALLGEACGATGQLAEGLSLLAEALDFAEQSGDRFFEAEIYRLRGELLLQSEATQAEVEECFHQAIKVAQRQEAKSLELRAVMSLARLWQRQGKITEARQMLAEIYGWFTEGFDTADLKEARALLDELHQ
jgi:TolB-like protein/predicted ATPase